MVKSVIKQLIPAGVLSFYHKMLAMCANIRYWYPSRKLVVIGVTGTKGKSTTVLMITKMLEQAGHTVGSMNSIFFQIGEKHWANKTKQSMLGRLKLQKMLRKMVRAGCTHVVLEVTSEGILQHRHHGIAFDIVAFTNLSPEHIDSHGSFTAYRHAKETIFKELLKQHRKKNVPKAIVVNGDDELSEKFLRYGADIKWIVHQQCNGQRTDKNKERILCADAIEQTIDGTTITIGKTYIHLPLHGVHMAENALLALACVQPLGVSINAGEEALEHITHIPGRSDIFTTKKGVHVMVDYAHEPKSFEAIMKTAEHISTGKMIVLFGVTGGGRDTSKRPVMGTIAAKHADYIILTTDDPYDDDPQELVDAIAPGIEATGNGWQEETNWWKIVDRKEAITKALTLAKKGDIVLLLGKGSEQTMAVKGGKYIKWNDMDAVKELLDEETGGTK